MGNEIPFAVMDEDTRAFICSIACNWAIVFCQAEAVYLYQQLFGVKYRRPMVWVKPDGAPQFTGDRPGLGYESIVTAWCSGGRSKWNGGGRHGIFKYNVGRHNQHPTQKPIALISELVSLFSLCGVVLDPFAGAGTTLIAAKKHELKAVGVELSEKYCELAAKRCSQTVMPLVTDKQRTCYGCGKPLVNKRIDSNYCSSRCRQAAYRQRQAVLA